MKKILLVLLGIGIATFSMANDNWYNKKVVNKKPIQNECMVDEAKRSIVATPMAPTIIRESMWDPFTSVWAPTSHTVHVYANNLIVIEYELGSNLSDTSRRRTFTYNSNQKLIQVLIQDWQSPGKYANVQRNTFNYFNNNLGTINSTEFYDQGLKDWVYTSRRTIELDTRSNQIKNIYENYSNGMWRMGNASSRGIIYLNDTSSKILDQVDSTYYILSNKLEPSTRTLRTYNTNNQIETEKFYSVPKPTDTLILRSIDSLYYTNNELSYYISYDVNNNILTKDYKVDSLVWLNYNPNLEFYENNYLQAIESSWNGNAWKKDSRVKISYPDNFGSSIILLELYTNSWFLENRISEIYDSKLNLIEQSQESYDAITSTWTYTDGNKKLIVYDASNYIIEEIISGINSITNTWGNLIKLEYLNYINISTGINTTNNTIEATLYPNPSADGKVSVNVNMEAASTLNIKVVDLKGSVVYTDKKELGKGLNTVELSGLQQGMYVVESSSEAGVSRVKLVVQ